MTYWKDIFPIENRYFETENGILYYGNCIDIMKHFPENEIDLIITDPPYGIAVNKMGFTNAGGKKFGNAVAEKSYFKNFDDRKISKAFFDLMLKISKNQIIWGGNYYIDYLYPTRCMLVWYKRDGLPIRSFADCEIAWTSFDKNSMVFNCRWDGFIRDSKEKKTGHPTQKALEVFKWCVNEFSKPYELILDPFIGSGTTAVACEEMNRKWIGIELDKNYCEIIKQRLLDIQLSLSFV